MKNNLVIIIIAAVAAGGAGFYGGMTYQKSRQPAFGQPGMRTGLNLQNGRGPTGMTGMRPVSGEISEIDENSITVKLGDGSSRVIIYSPTTKVTKASEATTADLQTGEVVTVIGTESTGGTLTAQSISVGGGMFARPTVETEGE